MVNSLVSNHSGFDNKPFQYVDTIPDLSKGTKRSALYITKKWRVQQNGTDGMILSLLSKEFLMNGTKMDKISKRAGVAFFERLGEKNIAVYICKDYINAFGSSEKISIFIKGVMGEKGKQIWDVNKGNTVKIIPLKPDDINNVIRQHVKMVCAQRKKININSRNGYKTVDDTRPGSSKNSIGQSYIKNKGNGNPPRSIGKRLSNINRRFLPSVPGRPRVDYSTSSAKANSFVKRTDHVARGHMPYSNGHGGGVDPRALARYTSAKTQTPPSGSPKVGKIVMKKLPKIKFAMEGVHLMYICKNYLGATIKECANRKTALLKLAFMEQNDIINKRKVESLIKEHRFGRLLIENGEIEEISIHKEFAPKIMPLISSDCKIHAAFKAAGPGKVKKSFIYGRIVKVFLMDDERIKNTIKDLREDQKKFASRITK